MSCAYDCETIMSSDLNRQRHLPARSKRWTSSAGRPEPIGPQNARRNYERYLALARAEAQIGNTVGAENYNLAQALGRDRVLLVFPERAAREMDYLCATR